MLRKHYNIMGTPSTKNASSTRISNKTIIIQSVLAIVFSLLLPLVLLGISEYLKDDDGSDYDGRLKPRKKDDLPQQQQKQQPHINIAATSKHQESSPVLGFDSDKIRMRKGDVKNNNDAAMIHHEPMSSIHKDLNSSDNNVAQTSKTTTDIMNRSKAELLDAYKQKNKKNSIISPKQLEAMEQVNKHKERTEADPTNPINWILLAHAQLLLDGTSLTGGLSSLECIKSFKKGVEILNLMEQSMQGSESSLSAHQTVEMNNLIEYKCVAYGNLAMAYNIAEMYEDVLDISLKFLNLSCQTMSARDVLSLSGRASSNLGRYKEAGAYFLRILSEFDVNIPLPLSSASSLPFAEIVNVLTADDNAVSGGWGWFSSEVTRFITVLDGLLLDNTPHNVDANSQRRAITESLQSAHRAMFDYYDKKTSDISQAWFHLEKANAYKQLYAPYDEDDSALRRQLRQRMDFFNQTLLNQATPHCGSDSKRPIFVIGHPRSGTTLLESILNAHPAISGLGEASVLMNMMPQIQTNFPYAYKVAGLSALSAYTKSVADTVLEGMNERFESNLLKADRGPEVTTATERLVDKQNINFHFVPYIHLIFPNALILHMVREPMDVLFSAYRLDLNNKNAEGNNNDPTSSFVGLAASYGNYRQVMNYWDEVLPGRILHIRYEDLVHDFEAVAKSVIKAADLDWDPSIFEFHKKERAINTPSANQVRQGLYTRSVQRWKKYEEFLKPMENLLADNAIYDQATNLPGYTRTFTTN